MSQSLTKMYVHLIFSTKNRESNIMPTSRDDLHKYMGGVLNGLDCPVIKVGGMADHVHLLFCLNKTMTISDVVKRLKANTTKWFKERHRCNFAWQRGYAAFSVSQSMLDDVSNYIANQEEHHRVRTFQEEYRAFLVAYGIKFDEAYMWD